MKKLILSLFAGAALLVSGCGTSVNLTNPPPADAQIAGFTQVEFIGRPAVGEGLLVSNDLLNTYNSVSPRFIAFALANPGSQEQLGAQPVLDQAVFVLNILTGLDPNNGPTTGDVVAGFLPDVCRIDTTLDFTPNTLGTETSAYGSVFNAAGSPVSGRKITDDVIDITVNFLTGGVLPGDNVGYYPLAGNAAVGHQRLLNEATDFGPSDFPFLAPPN